MHNLKEKQLIQNLSYEPFGLFDTIAGIAQVYLIGYNLLSPNRGMSDVINDISRSIPQLINTINSIQGNISQIKAAIENIDGTIRGVFDEQLALDALNRAKIKSVQVQQLMKNTTSLELNAEVIFAKSLEIEEEINVFLQRTQTKDGDVAGIYITAPLISVFSKAYTYSQRQIFLNANRDPRLAPTSFDSSLTQKMILFSENLVKEYNNLESVQLPFKDIPLPMLNTNKTTYRFIEGKGFVSTNIERWGPFDCLINNTNKFCLVDSLNSHNANEYQHLYSLMGDPRPEYDRLPFMTSQWIEVTMHGRTGKGYGMRGIYQPDNLDSLANEYCQKTFQAWKFFEHKSGKFFKDVETFSAIVNTMKAGTWEVNPLLNRYFRANCPSHDWEGPKQINYKDAVADLEEHKLLFPDENHDNAQVIETYDL